MSNSCLPVRRILANASLVGMCIFATPSSASFPVDDLLYFDGPIVALSSSGSYGATSIEYANWESPGFFDFQYTNGNFAPYAVSLWNNGGPPPAPPKGPVDPHDPAYLWGAVVETFDPNNPGATPTGYRWATFQLGGDGLGTFRYDTVLSAIPMDDDYNNQLIDLPVELTFTLSTPSSGEPFALSVSIQRIPEPQTLSLLTIALGALVWSAPRRRKPQTNLHLPDGQDGS